MSADRRRRPASRLADLRLVPAALVAWGVSWLLVGTPGAATGLAVGAWLAAGGAVAAAILMPSVRGAVVPVAMLLAATGLVATTVSLREPLRSPQSLADVRRFEVVTTAPLAAGDDRVRGTIGAVPVLVTGLDLGTGAGLGAALDVHGRLQTLPDGGAIAGILIADRAEVSRPPPGMLAWAEQLRSGFRAIAAMLPGDGGALLTGLAIGDDAGLPPEVEEAMTATSLSHLTAVSGANCAVVVGAALLAAAALGLPRRIRLLVALVVLAAFVVLVTPQPSVVRAAVMAALALVGLAADRPVRGVPLLALAVLLVVAADPWAAREVGFVLSVLATGGLLLVAGPLADRLAAMLPRPVALLVAVPAAAQLACQPVIVVLDPALPVAGVVANLLAGPAAPIATGLGLIACLVAPVSTALALALAWAAWLPSTWIAGVATVLADAPFARMPWPSDGAGLAAATVGSAAAIGWAVGRGRPARAAGAIALA